MKSYLSLVPISAKIRRRQNRMTLLCIIFVVSMVTAMFNMAEVGVRMEQTGLAKRRDGFSIFILSNNTMGQTLLLSTGTIFLLILFVGVLMVSSSLNSSMAQRTKFFGMMHCIGVSKKQIIRSVCPEALNWCKTAVPTGLALGVSASWILCGVLRYAAGEEFSNIPLSDISVTGIVSGIIVGVVTVLLVTRSSANQAARVPPVTAVSGNSEHGKMGNRTLHARSTEIGVALGIHHVTSAKKNLLLMAGSFALSIILLLSFTALIDFVNHLMSQSAATSNIDISSSDELNSIDNVLAETPRGMNGVKQVYGHWGSFDILAEKDTGIMVSSTVDLVSFDDFDLDCLKKNGTLRQGSNLSKVYGNSNHALATWSKDSSWKIGDEILIEDEEIEIADLPKYDPFSSNGLTDGKIILITSGQTFTRLTDIIGYSFVMVQTTSQVTDEDVSQLCSIVAESGSHLGDKQDQRTSGTYPALVFCIYCFPGVIILVTVLNIVSSTSASVSARIKQYGAIRAVGMDEQQITEMVFTEALTYAPWGDGVGCVIDLPLNRVLYDFFISDHLPYVAWSLPVRSLVIILLFVAFAATPAAYAPARRIRDTSAAETVNEL